MRKLLLSLVLIICISAAKAQTAEDSVKAVVNKLFKAMSDADPVALKECFADSAVLHTIINRPDGTSQLRMEISANNFAEQVSKVQKGMLDERITFDMIRIDANLATVWTPYKFYMNGNYRHCGANSFQLVRFSGQWKIVHLIDTRRRGCE